MNKFIKIVSDSGNINCINLNNIVCIVFKDKAHRIIIDFGNDEIFEVIKDKLEEYNEIKNEILNKLELMSC